MEAKLRAYVESLFEQAPNTRKAYELKEEMLQNLIEKYHDLCDEGKTEEVAYNIVVSSIGDTNELIASLSGVQPALTAEQVKTKRTYACLTALAIGLYILALIPIIALSPMGHAILGVALTLAFIAAASGILVYVSMTKPRYRRVEDTIVEEFKEWKASKESRTEQWRSISAALWMLVVIAYLLISFLTGAWHISWIIFLIGVAVENIIKAVLDLKK